MEFLCVAKIVENIFYILLPQNRWTQVTASTWSQTQRVALRWTSSSQMWRRPNWLVGLDQMRHRPLVVNLKMRRTRGRRVSFCGSASLGRSSGIRRRRWTGTGTMGRCTIQRKVNALFCHSGSVNLCKITRVKLSSL